MRPYIVCALSFPHAHMHWQTQYWQDMINGTGDDYYVYPANDTTVNVWDYKQCIEVGRLNT